MITSDCELDKIFFNRQYANHDCAPIALLNVIIWACHGVKLAPVHKFREWSSHNLRHDTEGTASDWLGRCLRGAGNLLGFSVWKMNRIDFERLYKFLYDSEGIVVLNHRFIDEDGDDWHTSVWISDPHTHLIKPLNAPCQKPESRAYIHKLLYKYATIHKSCEDPPECWLLRLKKNNNDNKFALQECIHELLDFDLTQYQNGVKHVK